MESEGYISKFADCLKKYSSKSYLNKHQLKHNRSQTFKCPNALCGLFFTNEDIFKEHVNSHFSQSEPKNNKQLKSD